MRMNGSRMSTTSRNDFEFEPRLRAMAIHPSERASQQDNSLQINLVFFIYIRARSRFEHEMMIKLEVVEEDGEL